VEPWVEPVIDWRTGEEAAGHHARVAQGELLAQWPPSPSEQFPTDCVRVGRDFLIWQRDVGGLRFRADEPSCAAFPAQGADPSWFVHVVTRSWLPAVYQVWGRQVLHASAAIRRDTGRVVAFAGPSGAGKSTLAYGLADRPGWRPLSDDTLAFSIDGTNVRLHPLQNNTRLRPSAASHFGVTSGLSPAAIEWPEPPIALDRIYFLSAHEDFSVDAEMELLPAPERYRLLLGQAHAFSLKLAEHNQRLMRDYLALAASVPIFRLHYRRTFGDLSRVLDRIEGHDTLRPSR